MNNSIEGLNWRYAVKKYDATKKLTDEQRTLIEEALRLAPSSFGFQGWKFVHVTDPATREELKKAAYGQTQLTDASDLYVLCSFEDLSSEHLDKFAAETAKGQGVPVESLAGARGYWTQAVQGKSPAERTEWLARQVYIALGVAIAVAAENRIDVNPMEGFSNADFDRILGLTAQGLKSRVLLAAGVRSAEDATQKFPRVRFSKEEVFIQK